LTGFYVEKRFGKRSRIFPEGAKLWRYLLKNHNRARNGGQQNHRFVHFRVGDCHAGPAKEARAINELNSWPAAFAQIAAVRFVAVDAEIATNRSICPAISAKIRQPEGSWRARASLRSRL
jgi:hypothetical protein